MYAKLFESIYQGTLRGNAAGLLVFTNLLAHANRDGIVDIHPRAIAEEVGLPIAQVRAALDELGAPDEESRSSEEEGRRIIRIDAHRAWGWRIVNHAKYRSIRSEDDRREQNRASQAAWRERQKAAKQKSASVSQASAESAHADTDTEADTEAKKKALADSAARRNPETKQVDDSLEGRFEPTFAGQVGMAFRRAGVPPMAINLSDPRLAALKSQGATVAEFEGLAIEAVGKCIDKPWPWVLAALPARRAQAKRIALAPEAATPKHAGFAGKDYRQGVADDGSFT